MIRPSARLAAPLAALMAWGCGLVDMGGGSRREMRRVFVNDAAANDSLPGAITRQGVYFVLQPGKNYLLRVQTPSEGDRLDLQIANGNYFGTAQPVTGAFDGTTLSFPLQVPPSRGTALFRAILTTADGNPTVPPQKVRLIPAEPVESNTLAVRLLLVRQLHGLPDLNSKRNYAREFLAELKWIYAGYGITLDTSSQIVEPDAPRMAVNFSSPPPLPGARRANTVHMYLVDTIYIPGRDPGGLILGFAPREAFDLSSETSSRVVLSVRSGPRTAATTAAHELGHFLGLRHTTATMLDMKSDNDQSNRDDGFGETPVCHYLSKPGAAEEITVRSPDGRAYCLYVASTASCNCPDRNNLMFAYACGTATTQRELSASQKTFLRQNLRLYQQ